MTPTHYAIQIRSLRQCIEHLHTLDLAELERGAVVYGTAQEIALIAAVRGCLQTLPRIHG